MKKIIASIIFLLILAAVIYGYIRWAQPKDSMQHTVPTQKIVTRAIQSRLEETGIIEPLNEVVIKSEVNGRVDSIYVEDGTYVTAGCVLVELDKTDLLNERKEYMLDHELAQLNLEKAELDFNRNRELYEKKLVSSEVYDSMRIERDLKRNRVAKIISQITTIDDKLKKSTIVAPMQGTILNRAIEVGEVVIGASSVSSGTEMMKIADLDLLQVSTSVNEVDIASIRTNMGVQVSVDSIPGHSFTGKVDHIAPMAIKNTNNQIQGFEVTILLEGDVSGLKPGMTANLTMILAEATNAVTAPLAAVFCENYEAAPAQQRFYVYLETPTGFVERAVVIGLNDMLGIQISEGIEPGVSVALERPTPKDETRRKHEDETRRGRD